MKESGLLFLKCLWLNTGIASIILLSSCTPALPTPATEENSSWQSILEEDLHLLGHRNWILVVDKAFPEQSSPGMKYLYVDQDLISTLEQVLEKVEASSHVKPVIYQDQELNYITEEQVEGIAAFRSEMATVLAGREANTLLHEEVFQMLDESSSLFRVLVIKTKTALPYTSVFLQLDCAYWTPEQEKQLRDLMAEQGITGS
jgi:D-ribose pyranose/furanose isomerase RbsD